MAINLGFKKYLDRIETNFAEPINSYKVIQQGWTNLAIEINNRWIFRFVRDKTNRQIAVERDFLPQFAIVSPVNIPDLRISQDDYIAYPKILGERFSPQKFSSFSVSQKTELIKSIGRFLTCLHNFQFSHQYLSEAPYGGQDFWNDLWLVVKDNLSLKTKNRAESYFVNAIAQIEKIPFAPTLIHADLGTNTKLINVCDR